SKHLRALRQAGLVRVRADAPRRFYELDPVPLAELDAWLEPYRKFWDRHLDALGRHLEDTDPTDTDPTDTDPPNKED
ncbi:MAG: ArsR/SmtB family transcription factor, partial [Solirubrobacteraceae bacterium]